MNLNYISKQIYSYSYTMFRYMLTLIEKSVCHQMKLIEIESLSKEDVYSF